MNKSGFLDSFVGNRRSLLDRIACCNPGLNSPGHTRHPRKTSLSKQVGSLFAACTRPANHDDVLIARQFVQPVRQFIQRDQNAFGDMSLSPFFLSTHIQEQGTRLVLLMGLGHRDFSRKRWFGLEQQKGYRSQDDNPEADP